MKRVSHLYVHVPFCRRRCHYCDFYSVAGRLELAPRYVRALPGEAAGHGALLQGVETIYIGGGTPSLLGPELLHGLLEGLTPLAASAAEVSVEVNPGSLDAATAAAMAAGGVTRVTMGVQSLSSRLRHNLGRRGSADAARAAMGVLREAGFDNVGLDMIFAIPGQERELLERDIESVLELEPEHISYYELTVAPESDFARRHRAALARVRQRSADDYALVVERLEAAGFHWYETSNCARPGYESRHNLAYWQGRDYLGLGAGAWSTVAGERWQNRPDLDAYISCRGEPARLRRYERLTGRQQLVERLMLGLRTSRGVPRELVAGIVDGTREAELVQAGFLEAADDRYTLTRKGRFVGNEVTAALVAEP